MGKLKIKLKVYIDKYGNQYLEGARNQLFPLYKLSNNVYELNLITQLPVGAMTVSFEKADGSTTQGYPMALVGNELVGNEYWNVYNTLIDDNVLNVSEKVGKNTLGFSFHYGDGSSTLNSEPIYVKCSYSINNELPELSASDYEGVISQVIQTITETNKDKLRQTTFLPSIIDDETSDNYNVGFVYVLDGKYTEISEVPSAPIPNVAYKWKGENLTENEPYFVKGKYYRWYEETSKWEELINFEENIGNAYIINNNKQFELIFYGKESFNKLKNITWEELKNLRDNKLLIPGQKYKIIDYTCTTSQNNTISAHHDFDIIVTADSCNTLNENAKACLKEGDTYFRTTKDGLLYIIPIGYQYSGDNFGGIDYESLQKNIEKDIFISANYAINPHGYNSPVLYKTQSDHFIYGYEYQYEPDIDDPFFYFGTWELDGVIYDRWKKEEKKEQGLTWSNDDFGDLYLLTEKLVQGTPISSDTNNFNPSNCTFIEEKLKQNEYALDKCKLESWELKYSLDNDTTRFAWADTTNGKGVIYYMKDDHGNEAWYDFKNIKFICDFFPTYSPMPTSSLWFNTPVNDDYIFEDYYYTFHLEGGTDLSVKALISSGYNANIELWHPKNNKINSKFVRVSYGGPQFEVLYLPFIVFYTNRVIVDNNEFQAPTFLWENTNVSGWNNLIIGTTWNVNFQGDELVGLCGRFVDSNIICNRMDTFLEGLNVYNCNINIKSRDVKFYKIPNGAQIQNNLCNKLSEPNKTYIYTENFKDPELLMEERYEEEEE